jgi:hypothetical protein
MEDYHKIDELRQEAERAARVRGHSLGNWERVSTTHDLHTVLEAACWVCGASVTIDNQPEQSSDGINGIAVAVNCGDD